MTSKTVASNKSGMVLDKCVSGSDSINDSNLPGALTPRKSESLPESSIALEPTVLAEALMHPVAAVGNTLRAFRSGLPAVDSAGMAAELMKQVRSVNDGDLGRGEAMLVTQAHALDAMFNTLCQWALKESRIEDAEVLMRLGLKAQSQCRATVESLARIKNPPSFTSIQQANMTAGPQQINNHAAAAKAACRTRKPPNKLSGASLGLLSNAGPPALTFRVDPPMAALAYVDGSEDGAG